MSNIRKVPIFLFQILLGWLVAAPLSYLMRKQSNLIAFIGRDNGIFVDNVKYFYLYLHKLSPKDITYYFVTENTETYTELKNKGFPVLLYPSIESISVLLRSKIVIVDNWTWITNMKYHLLLKSIKIQIWHGIPLKKIELDTDIEMKINNPLFIKIRNFLGCRYPEYDCVVSTSDFITQSCFSSAFNTKNFINSGYPRNDILFNTPTDSQLINSDTQAYLTLTKFKSQGYRIVLYTPTFRDTGNSIIEQSLINFKTLSKFATDNKIIFLLKFHPNSNLEKSADTLDNIIQYDKYKDIYPVLNISDILITDYSSLYFDYLLLNKPVIFFCHDLYEYLEHNREIYFEYDIFTPGTKVVSQKELQNEIIRIIGDKTDSFSELRGKTRNKVFEHTDDESSERLWNYITKKYLHNLSQ